jgi:hypothetical protein
VLSISVFQFMKFGWEKAMNVIRMLCRYAMAIVLAALALPAFAAASPDKVFKVTATPAVVVVAGASVVIDFANVSPNGNSVIGSIILQPPTGVTFVLGQPLSSGKAVTCPASTPNGPPVPGSLCIANISGVKPGGHYKITLATTPNASLLCSNTQWAGQAFTGNSFGGTSFVDPATLSPFSMAPAYVACDATIACNGSFESKPSNAGTSDPGYVLVGRWKNNQDGASASSCLVTGYTFTNDILTLDGSGKPKNTTHLYWDTTTPVLGQPLAIFSYVINTAPMPKPSGGQPGSLIPGVSWLNDTNGAPVYVPALACLGTNPAGGNLPASYGTLVADSGGTTVVIDTSGSALALPATVPFPVQIETEYMTVAAVSSVGTNQFQLTVSRPEYSGAHASAVSVFSSPLPLIPGSYPVPYVAGHPAKMCLNGLDWKPVGGGLYQYFLNIIDAGDGYVRGSF